MPGFLGGGAAEKGLQTTLTRMTEKAKNLNQATRAISGESGKLNHAQRLRQANLQNSASAMEEAANKNRHLLEDRVSTLRDKVIARSGAARARTMPQKPGSRSPDTPKKPVKETGADIGEFVKKHPWATLGIGAGAPVAAGLAGAGAARLSRPNSQEQSGVNAQVRPA